MTPSSSPRINKSYFLLFLSGSLCIILISGCGLNKQKELYSPSEAEEEFLQICKDEYKLDVTTRLIDNTLWIYLPYQKDILKIKANRYPQINKCITGYLKGDFTEGVFYFEYQTTPLAKSQEDKGYTYDLVDQINEHFYHLLSTIYRIYFNAQQEPEFFVIVRADIANGMEVINTVYNQDLKKFYSQAIPPGEISKRILQDIKGGLEIINDNTGQHLNYHQITLSQFLTEQIIQRIRLATFRMDFKSCWEPEEEILEIISFCVDAYEFEDLSNVILKNLSSGEKITISSMRLEEFREF